jgi:TPR repeat protein
MKKCNPGDSSCLFKELENVLWIGASMFIEQGDNPIALCYAALLSGLNNHNARFMIEKAAKMGHPLAMFKMTRNRIDNERMVWTHRAAQAGDREALRLLGSLYRDQRENTEARDAFKRAAELGETYSMIEYGRTLSWQDQWRHIWNARAAKRGCMSGILDFFCGYTAYPDQATYWIGRELNGNIGVEKIFGRLDIYKIYYDIAVTYRDQYTTWNSSAQQSTFCWMNVAKRLGLYRDVAKLIGLKIWELRSKWQE